MASSLIRGKYVVAKVLSRTEVEVIPDGAVFQRDGTIVEIGRHADLAARHQPDEVLGSPDHVDGQSSLGRIVHRSWWCPASSTAITMSG